MRHTFQAIITDVQFGDLGKASQGFRQAGQPVVAEFEFAETGKVFQAIW